MTFAIVHAKPAAPSAPALAEGSAPTPTPTPTPAAATPSATTAKITRSVSAKATVLVPESAEKWAEVAFQAREFSRANESHTVYGVSDMGRSFLSGVAECLPWVAGVASLFLTSGVGVAAALGWAGTQRTLRLPKPAHNPVDAAHIAKLRDSFSAAQALASDNPLKQAAQRHVVINHLTAALAYRGLCVEGELLLQDLRYEASPKDVIDAAGKRAADAAKALLTPSSHHPQFPDLEPFEAVALQQQFPKAERDTNMAVSVGNQADRAQQKIDRAVSGEVQRLLNQKLASRQNEG